MFTYGRMTKQKYKFDCYALVKVGNKHMITSKGRKLVILEKSNLVNYHYDHTTTSQDVFFNKNILDIVKDVFLNTMEQCIMSKGYRNISYNEINAMHRYRLYSFFGVNKKEDRLLFQVYMDVTVDKLSSVSQLNIAYISNGCIRKLVHIKEGEKFDLDIFKIKDFSFLTSNKPYTDNLSKRLTYRYLDRSKDLYLIKSLFVDKIRALGFTNVYYSLFAFSRKQFYLEIYGKYPKNKMYDDRKPILQLFMYNQPVSDDSCIYIEGYKSKIGLFRYSIPYDVKNMNNNLDPNIDWLGGLDLSIILPYLSQEETMVKDLNALVNINKSIGNKSFSDIDNSRFSKCVQRLFEFDKLKYEENSK